MGEPSEESSKKRRRRKRNKSSGAADEDGEDTKSKIANIKDEPENDGEDHGVSPSKVGSQDGDVASADDEAVAIKEENDDDEGDKEDDDAKEETKKRKRKRKRKSKANPEGADGEANDTNESDAAKLQSVEHTVFIEGLPFTSTEDEIRSFFTNHGCNDILQLRLPTWQDSGRLRGFGHVVFSSKETRSHALSEKVNGQELGGRYITVKEANAPRAGTTAGAIQGNKAREQPKGCKTVYVRNLPYEATEEQILETFRTCGKIVDGGVRVVRNPHGQSKGFGYVEYKNEEGALAAVQKAAKPFGLVVMKRPVFVDYDEGSMKGSFRDREGKLWNKGGHAGSSSGGRGGRGGRGGGRGDGRGPGSFGRGHR